MVVAVRAHWGTICVAVVALLACSEKKAPSRDAGGTWDGGVSEGGMGAGRPLPGPRAKVVSVAPEYGVAGTVYNYSPKSDQAGETEWEVKSGPSGLKTDEKRQRVSWPLEQKNGGAHKVELVGKTASGKLVQQEYSVTVSNPKTQAAAKLAPDEGGMVVVKSPTSKIRGASVNVQPGAIGSGKRISIAEVDAAPPTRNAKGNVKVVQFGPEKTVFERPALVSLPLDDEDAIDTTKVGAYVYDPKGRWSRTRVVRVDTANKLVYARAQHFSLYAAIQSGFWADLDLKAMPAASACEGSLAAQGSLATTLHGVPTSTINNLPEELLALADNLEDLLRSELTGSLRFVRRLVLRSGEDSAVTKVDERVLVTTLVSNGAGTARVTHSDAHGNALASFDFYDLANQLPAIADQVLGRATHALFTSGDAQGPLSTWLSQFIVYYPGDASADAVNFDYLGASAVDVESVPMSSLPSAEAMLDGDCDGLIDAHDDTDDRLSPRIVVEPEGFISAVAGVPVRLSATLLHAPKDATLSWSLVDDLGELISIQGAPNQRDFVATKPGHYQVDVESKVKGSELHGEFALDVVEPSELPTCSPASPVASLKIGEQAALTAVLGDSAMPASALTIEWGLLAGTDFTSSPELSAAGLYAPTTEGAHVIACRVADGERVGPPGSIVLAVLAADANRLPTDFLLSPPSATLVIGATLELTASADDPDGDALSFAWSGPTGTLSAITKGGKQSSAKFRASQAGASVVRVTVSDGSPFVQERSVTIVVIGSQSELLAKDEDRDGWPAGGKLDCDDADPEVNPGTIDDCSDDKDNDCSGSARADDCDDDGFSVAQLDCDDADARRYPGAPEYCDGLDNDCSGTRDEGFSVGQTCSSGIGGCASTGQLGCAPDHVNTVCTAPLLLPKNELCNGIDDDCDGATPVAEQDADHDGALACNNDCRDDNAKIFPAAQDVCDGLDNNCNGATDEGFVSSTVTCGTGACLRTVQSKCVAGAVDTTCTPGTAAASDTTCDNVDDDCDGTPDDNGQLVFYADSDGDGFGDANQTTTGCTAPAGYVFDATDCDDGVNAIHPGVFEACNGIDDNCIAGVDEGVGTTFYADADADGFGGTTTTQACSLPQGHTTTSTDCDDGANAVHPGAAELCNGVDDNCDSNADEGVTLPFYADSDADGYGNPSVSVAACSAPNGYVANASDCNDTSNAVFPGATEICNGTDDDCSGGTDNGVGPIFYADVDGDGHGNSGVQQQACSAPTNYVASNDDCDDGANSRYPGASEVCDGIDQDCDSVADDGVQTQFFLDFDGDSFGDPAQTQLACSAPSQHVANSNDCDDTRSDVSPLGSDTTCDGVDQDCDSSIDDDYTSVGCPAAAQGICAFGTTLCSAGGNVACIAASPAIETCNGTDDDCDGFIDNGVQTQFFADTDGDTFGDPNVSTLACTAPSQYVLDNSDCDDGQGAIHPGVTETCNGVDDDCANGVDDGVQLTFYLDSDGDSYGDPAVTTLACAAAGQYVEDSSDCDDGRSDVNPGTLDTSCDDVDQDCDASADEDYVPGTCAATGVQGACTVGTSICNARGMEGCIPGSPVAETCNGVDDDCDGTPDNGVQTQYFLDNDGDSYGDPNLSVFACSPPLQHVLDNTDCDDAALTVNPAALEVCNSIDDDCANGVDDGVQNTYYLDGDSDGYGTAATSVQACSQPALHVTNSTDCDDTRSDVSPGGIDTNCDGVDQDCDTVNDDEFSSSGCTASAQGVCAQGSSTCNLGVPGCDPGPAGTESCNGLDDDCDGTPDDGVTTTFYLDTDGDGFGLTQVTTQACSVPGGYAAVDGDCDDASNAVNPNASEVCNDLDDDCANGIDDGVLLTFYFDGDGDGFGDVNTTAQDCTAPGQYVADDTDCDDLAFGVNPAGNDANCDDVDQDCDDVPDSGYPSTSCLADAIGECAAGTSLCTSGSESCVPGSPTAEVCDGLDNNCDQGVDEGVTTIYYRDDDGDGYGTVDATSAACSLPQGFATQAGDCDEASTAVNPGATELCNDIDDNCDGNVDEGVQTAYHLDGDGDLFGDSNTTTFACSPPSRYVEDGTDCDDFSASVNPDGVDTDCDGVDQDCDDVPDDDFASGTCFIDAVGDCGRGVYICTGNGQACDPFGPVPEVCDGFDNDCNFLVDDGVSYPAWGDEDGDGYGNPDLPTDVCNGDPLPPGVVDNSDDCDDQDVNLYPGSVVYQDYDQDGHGVLPALDGCQFGGTYSLLSDDCDPSNPAAAPGLTEVCDGFDNDCNSSSDEGGVCVCGCDVTAGTCDNGCNCDPDCAGFCSCDVTPGSCNDPGCACDCT